MTPRGRTAGAVGTSGLHTGPVGATLDRLGAVGVPVEHARRRIGEVLDLWPRTAAGGWDSRGYGWALAGTLALQLLAVLWAWRGAAGLSVSRA